jgi:hypothetical protein
MFKAFPPDNSSETHMHHDDVMDKQTIYIYIYTHTRFITLMCVLAGLVCTCAGLLKDLYLKRRGMRRTCIE